MAIERKSRTSIAELDDWHSKWTSLKDGALPGWHLSGTNPSLVTIDGEPFVKENDRTIPIRGRVLVPLCGATDDMQYLSNFDAVTEVVGVEISERAIDVFFKAHSLTPNIEPLSKSSTSNGSSDGCVYVSGKIKIFKMDMLLFADSEKFDFIWDRASLMAIDPCYRSKYCQVMESCLKGAGDYVVVGIEYPEGPFTGPPRMIHDRQIKECFEDSKLFETIDKLGPDGPIHPFPRIDMVGKEVPGRPGVLYFNGRMPSMALWLMRH